MSSERRIRASRANGAKSPGPKTPESKRRSAANSLRHGLLSRTIVLEDENLQSFSDLLSSLDRDLHPQNEIERALIENMAIGRWRLLRVWAMERSSLKAEMDKHDPSTRDSGARAALAFQALSDESRSLHLLNRYEARFHRQYHRSLTRLLEIRQASRPLTSAKSTFYQTTLVPKSNTSPPVPSAPPATIS